ncbi:MAG: hypothetical protein LBQ58_01755 [Synergistaceae bacterium]|nr:hypothetical protein [Synergistaceae bacterium]
MAELRTSLAADREKPVARDAGKQFPRYGFQNRGFHSHPRLDTVPGACLWSGGNPKELLIDGHGVLVRGPFKEVVKEARNILECPQKRAVCVKSRQYPKERFYNMLRGRF